jgi:hypothetical protein
MTQTGVRLDLAGLNKTLELLAWLLEAEAEDTKGKKRKKEVLLNAAKEVRELMPDLEAMPPAPDPVKEAQLLLWNEAQRAQSLLSTEAARIRKETTIKAAFCIPSGLLAGIIEILCPDLEGEEHRKTYDRLVDAFEDIGWRVYRWTSHLQTNEQREPLRQLSALLEEHPGHHLTGQVRELLALALSWCANTSHNKAPGLGDAPEGVLYPRISLELVPVKNKRDVPKEWREPLVKKDGK